MLALEIAFWTCLALLVHTHAGYPLLLAALTSVRGPRRPPPPPGARTPRTSLVVAAFDEEELIGAKVADALALDYPRELLEVIVASDGSTDRTAELARAAGADLVLELPRRGKIAAQNEAVRRAGGEVIAFSDANAFWEPGALRELVAPFADPKVGYVAGRVRFLSDGGGNEEGTYWRYELAVRALESRLAGITAGNGAIYAVRREAYRFCRPHSSHDLTFPFLLAADGWRSVEAPGAIARERMVPTLRGEYERKRRMMRGVWAIMLRDGMLRLGRYGPMYAFELLSHRVLRYLSPFLHLAALGLNLALLGQGRVYTATLAAQVALLAAAAIGSLPGPGAGPGAGRVARTAARPFRLAYYYVAVTWSIAAGLWDYITKEMPAAWEKSEGTR